MRMSYNTTKLESYLSNVSILVMMSWAILYTLLHFDNVQNYLYDTTKNNFSETRAQRK